MSRNTLTILGSSSGRPQPDRAGSGYLLRVGESLTLLDCGSGVTSSLLRRGYDPLGVDRAFITHSHPDHVVDLPLFIQLIYLEGRREPFDVYLPAEFVEPFRAYLRATYLIERKLPFELNLHSYREGLVCDTDYRLTAIANRHLRGYAALIDEDRLPNKMQCYSFVIEVDGRSLLYTSDIASLDDVAAHLGGKDVVIIEPTHIDLDDFFRRAQDLKVGRYVVSHLGDNAEVAAINRMAAEAGVDNLVTAVDGMEVEL
ncbi:MAG: MBL fold metallo-hydrolase [Candidatus Zixiibacteriota bacterium]|nr:MAG: MBL fold metallo-hydrolase [candidate division Zixibacteria bacterium]